MTFYTYEAHDRQSGKEVTGGIDAGSQAEAIAAIKEKGLLPIVVRTGTDEKEPFAGIIDTLQDKLTLRGHCYMTLGLIVLFIVFFYGSFYLEEEIDIGTALVGGWWCEPTLFLIRTIETIGLIFAMLLAAASSIQTGSMIIKKYEAKS